jgi:oxalate decarboxylase
MYDESMRTIHWHNSDELGYCNDGSLDIFIWDKYGNSTKTHCPKGYVWYIPKGLPHSLHNPSSETAKLFISFNNPDVTSIDISVVLNGLPQFLKDEYSGSPHSLLKNFKGPNTNYYFNEYPKNELGIQYPIISKYVFNLDGMKPTINSDLGTLSIIDKWPATNIDLTCGILNLESNVSTGNFWYENVDALYLVATGKAYIYPILSGYNLSNNQVLLNELEVFFVPKGTSHSILNISDGPLKMVVFYSSWYPKINTLTPSLLFWNNNFIECCMITDQCEQITQNNSIVIKNIPFFIQLKNDDNTKT